MPGCWLGIGRTDGGSFVWFGQLSLEQGGRFPGWPYIIKHKQDYIQPKMHIHKNTRNTQNNNRKRRKRQNRRKKKFQNIINEGGGQNHNPSGKQEREF